MSRRRHNGTSVPSIRYALLALSLATALAGCGGGGGNTRADPPPTAPPPPPPPPDPPPTVVEPPNPAYSNHIAWTNTGSAHDAGLTGEGIRIGIVDSGVNRGHPALAGRVVDNLVYLDPDDNDLSVDDVVGHGTAVAQALAGTPFGQWPGGIAPGAQIVSARIISDDPPEDDGSGDGNEVDGALGLAPIHQDLIDRDVHIMNNSWGGLYWTNPAATAEIAAEYRPFIVEHGGLVVFATGNESKPNPSDMAALPSQPGPNSSTPAADLEQGWLAVAALSENNASQLAGYSNACGVAMHYCLAAPGTVAVTGTNDAPDAPQYWRWSGTSLAAPLVSGAAALVWEKYPYFDNDLVRQTLLGTATDLGAAGVDPVFGYGRLDVGRAVNGPARLDWGDVTVEFDNVTSTWGNEISGDGAIIKRGTGTLVFGWHAMNDGGVQVLGGTVQSTHIVAGDVTVGTQGRFVLGTEVGGNLDNAGRVDLVDHGGQSGDARRASWVNGDYRQRDGATLAVTLGQGMIVLGGITLDGGSLHVLGVRPGYVTLSREEIMFAHNGVTGTFDELTSATGVFLEGSLDYGPFQVWLDITRLDVAATAAKFSTITPAALSSAERVEQAFREIDRQRGGQNGVTSGSFVEVAGKLQQIDNEESAKAALSSLSGELHALAVTQSLDAIDMSRRALSSRFGDLADGDRAGAWRQSLGHGGHGGFAGGDAAVHGWSMGRDHRLGDRAFAGFAFGETRTEANAGGNSDRNRDRQAHGQFYTGVLRGDAYAMAQLGFGRFDRDIQRSLFAGDEWQGVDSTYSGNFSTASVETGRHYRFGNALLTPYLGAEQTWLDSNGFHEDGGNGFGLKANAWRANRTQAIAGVRAEHDWRGLTLHGYTEWQQTLDADGFDVEASFVGIDSWSPLPSLSSSRSGGLFGIGIDAWLSRDAMLSFGYDQRFGPRGDERMASLRYAVGF